MKKRPFGGTGMKVGEVGIGAMQFGDPRWQGPELDEVRCIVDEAVALGSNSSTPLGPMLWAGARREEAVEDSLRRLRTETSSGRSAS